MHYNLLYFNITHTHFNIMHGGHHLGILGQNPEAHTYVASIVLQLSYLYTLFLNLCQC